MYKKVNELKPIDAAYLAGLMDGEGSIMLTKRRKAALFPSPAITVPSTSYSLVKIFKDLIGTGTIIQKKKYKEYHKQSYVYSVGSATQCLDFCRQILPYLREELKWKRAKKLLSEWEILTPRNGKYTQVQMTRKQKFVREFKTLNGN